MILRCWIILRMRHETDESCNVEAHILSYIFFSKFFRLWGDVEKHGTARQVTGDTALRLIRIFCRITKNTVTQNM
jgi:hypothetical protein